MARESDMKEFTRSLFRGRPDLSTLTHSIVRRRFLAHAGRDHLEPEEKQALKRLVEEELLKMQVDETGAREEKLDFRKKTKRPPTPCSDPERKRFRFNSESEPSSTASSPECFPPPTKNGMAAAEVSSAEEESPRRPLKKAIEESSDEDEQRDLTAKAGLEEVMKESSEEEEGSARMNKVWKEENSEEEEGEEEEEKESKGRTRKKTVTKNKQVPAKASANRKQAREENEDCEDEPSQRAGKKGEGKQSIKSPQENKKSEEEEETPAKKKENREEEENWKSRARSNGGKRPAQEERSCKQTSRAGRLMADLWGEEEEEATHSRDDSEGDEKPLVQRKNRDGTQCKNGKRQSESSEEDGADSWREVNPTVKGTRKAIKAGSTDGEESDLEREVSDSEAAGKPKEEKNRSSKKSSKKGRTRSSSSSSDGSLEPRGGKADSGRHGEDHPAVMRLKRYIRACGAHRNYKKLLGSCRSHKECLSVLRAELEALGMKGNPSLEKCRALKEQREEAAEVASLDIANIISSSGRPRRRTAWNPSREAAPLGELYRRTLDSEEELPHPPPPDWSHMRGIISSDGESN